MSTKVSGSPAPTHLYLRKKYSYNKNFQVLYWKWFHFPEHRWRFLSLHRKGGRNKRKEEHTSIKLVSTLFSPYFFLDTSQLISEVVDFNILFNTSS